MERMTLGGLSSPRFVVLLKAARGYHVVDVRTILYVRAETRFSRMYFIDGNDKAVFHALTEIEDVLCCGKRVGELLFLRSQKSYIVALHHATSIDRSSGILFGDGYHVRIGREYWGGCLKTATSIRSGQ